MAHEPTVQDLLALIHRQQAEIDELKLRIHGSEQPTQPGHGGGPPISRMSRAKLFKAAAAVAAAGVAGAALAPAGQALAQSKDNNFVATGLPNGIGFDADARDKQGAPVFSEGVVGAGTSDGVRGTSDTGSGVRGTPTPGGSAYLVMACRGFRELLAAQALPRHLRERDVRNRNRRRQSWHRGVEGVSDTSDGVLGTSRDGSGVHGLSDQGSGVAGNSSLGTGVQGSSSGSHGVYGKSSAKSKAGVFGEHGSHGNGVAGRSSKSDGVFGESFDDGHAGVSGQNHGSGGGVRGVSAAGNGVEGSASGSGRGCMGSAIASACTVKVPTVEEAFSQASSPLSDLSLPRRTILRRGHPVTSLSTQGCACGSVWVAADGSASFEA